MKILIEDYYIIAGWFNISKEQADKILREKIYDAYVFVHDDKNMELI